MTLYEFPDVEQGSEEWHKQRRGMVTASVMGQLITPATIKAAVPRNAPQKPGISGSILRR